MSLENEDRSSTDHVSEIGEVRKHSKVSYTREFLLSLSQLEICKKIPTGFDQSILSELEDTSRGIQDRQRIPGSLPSQGFRRSDYSSSPPTRGDSDGNSRGIYGRWESRSSGRSDRDSDTQSDKDSDPVRRYGNQARRTWQSSEHDGLLGSGSFPKPSAYASGVSAAKVRASDNHQLNRSNEPYHPPRPYKAMPHSRRNTDACNDETFGSIESASEDRVEEERRRRASFELMRKEQQKTLQDKQKSNPEKPTAEYDSDISVLLENNKKDRRLLDKNAEVDITTSQPCANNESGKSSSFSQNLPSRPLVPPGFKTTVSDKNSGSATLNHSCLTEIGKHETEEILLEAKSDAQNGICQSLERQSSREISSSDQLERKSLHASILKKNDQIVKLSVNSDDSDRKFSMEDHSRRTSTLDLNEPAILELSAQNSGGKFVAESNINHSISILDKIFGSAIANLTDSDAPVTNEDSKPNDKLDPKAVQSSKFAHWFFEEERKLEDDSSSSRPSDLLALIVGGDKNRKQPFEGNTSEQLPSEFSYKSLEPTSKFVSDLPSSPLGGPELVYKSSKREAAPTILTCEDLEHTMLSEFSEKKSNSQPQGWSTNRTKTEKPVNVDSQASQHLLSLLQKGPNLGNVTQRSNAGIESLEAHGETTVQDRSKKEDNNSHASGNTLTLESLFGTAFMTELQSAQAPVSVQRISVGSGLHDSQETQKSSLPSSDDTLSSSIIDDIGLRGATKENNVLPSNCRDHPKLDKAENWLGFNDSSFEVNSLKRQTEAMSRNGDYRAGEFRLPEGESLFSVGDPLVSQVPMPAGNMSKGDLVTVNSVGSDQRSLVGPGALPFPRVSHDQIESEMLFHHLRAQPSSSQFHPLQMSQGKPLLHPLDSRPAHLNSQIFSGPEGMIRHDALPGHQFAGSMMRPPFHHPNARVTGFDLPAHHPMLQQMQMSGTHPPHLLHDRLNGGPVPSHSSNQAAGFVHEVNPMQGFPFTSHQVNINGLGMQAPGPDINSRNNHPEALQRLIEMELKASKQNHTFPAGRGRGMYGHELDMGLRYR
ncbi:PREDICTED: uncharacterized protein LOC109226469 isoform X1 [Nicotiana attenuata]|uniref:Uncharacterized protein n=1 Tax=Nicotiana attenuata TaxID=49451 RepID=A0A1J6JEE4_NICAT|nr:PREDICTED: uncharacterized protein LOC109226469 isoform X1 [Nicotiana attenuata]XP_019246782.1 PREDICTED: uncharacterized protein LOC109226469 isoform X1 [Nicotiana attenuata]XP_019246789.1 PREDICTED: uncharacterized protein LOC109226469 isoform X1 [Nicotiana attenuata]OIT08047.1 hypothetical protein A4A49_11846 [Nicotiana attenuata]